MKINAIIAGEVLGIELKGSWERESERQSGLDRTKRVRARIDRNTNNQN